jgi:hypothetical protein
MRAALSGSAGRMDTDEEVLSNSMAHTRAMPGPSSSALSVGLSRAPPRVRSPPSVLLDVLVVFACAIGEISATLMHCCGIHHVYVLSLKLGLAVGDHLGSALAGSLDKPGVCSPYAGTRSPREEQPGGRRHGHGQWRACVGTGS